MSMALFEHLSPVCERLARLNDSTDGKDFASQLLMQRPDAFINVKGGINSEDAIIAADVIARLTLESLRAIPTQANAFQQILRSPDASPELVTMISYSLAYLVSPIDLLHDDLPGGFGFVDDAIMLWAIIAATFYYADDPKNYFQFAVDSIRTLNMSLPRDVARHLEPAARDAINVRYLLRFAPQDKLLKMAWKYINYPQESIIEALRVLVDPPPLGPVSQGADFFSLPDGGVGYSGDGMLVYQFEDGDFIALG